MQTWAPPPSSTHGTYNMCNAKMRVGDWQMLIQSQTNAMLSRHPQNHAECQIDSGQPAEK